MKGKAFIAGAMMLAALVSACSTHTASTTPAPAPGEVTGFAEPCSGIGPILHPSPPPMMVYVQQHGQAIAQQKLPGNGGVYHFSLPPGSYVISAPRSKDPPQSITLHSKETVKIDFPNRCA
jgi:hypothetical protein